MTYLVISITCVYVKLKVFVHIVMEVAPANTFFVTKMPYSNQISCFLKDIKLSIFYTAINTIILFLHPHIVGDVYKGILIYAACTHSIHIHSSHTHEHAQLCKFFQSYQKSQFTLFIVLMVIFLWVLYRFTGHALRGKSFRYQIILFFPHSTLHFRSTHFCNFNFLLLTLDNCK